MAMLVISLVLGMLAVTRVTWLLVEDRIALRYRNWARRKWGEDSLAADFVDCPWCTSIWVGALIMPPSTILPNMSVPYVWVIALLAIPASSLVAAMIAEKIKNDRE